MIAKRHNGRRFRFSIAMVMVVTLAIALALFLWRLDPMVFWIALTGVVAANFLGYAVGWLFTYVLRLPNDGSLNWDPDDADWEHGDATPP